MVYDYLTALGYADPMRVQQEAANSDLSCLIRFYSGEYQPTGAHHLQSLLSAAAQWDLTGALCLPLKTDLRA